MVTELLSDDRETQDACDLAENVGVDVRATSATLLMPGRVSPY